MHTKFIRLKQILLFVFIFQVNAAEPKNEEEKKNIVKIISLLI